MPLPLAALVVAVLLVTALYIAHVGPEAHHPDFDPPESVVIAFPMNEAHECPTPGCHAAIRPCCDSAVGEAHQSACPVWGRRAA